ncbi:protein UXT homolog [Chrysoperla carnea]|uniref:protein UXT homolog n=1 Tax=Chrysoperla carnea TaxID=189513 RepID=UPI001D0858BB|nr:protein UXT homolog [Chrysoperla carnea]
METDKEIIKYETFINDILKEDLKLYDYKLSKLNEELTQYYELKSTIKHLLNLKATNDGTNSIDVKSLMDVGCNFMMEAHVEDVSNIIIHVGLEYYLEFPLKEADKYVESRIEMLMKQVEHLKSLVIETKAKIKICLIGIGELQKMN